MAIKLEYNLLRKNNCELVSSSNKTNIIIKK